jgi:phosphoribosylanthranilate isomerase
MMDRPSKEAGTEFRIARKSGGPKLHISKREIAASVPRMSPLARFLDPAAVSLKICGVTTRADAERLAGLEVAALGVNFWPRSKRYLAPERAGWLRELAGAILRIGVFVNEPPDLPLRLMATGLLDAIQLHGDESPEDAAVYRDAGIPFIKAIGVRTRADLGRAAEYRAAAVLLDAHAPGVYGGTGEVFDWQVAADFRDGPAAPPVILAGGIVPENAARAAAAVRPAALDIASGAEISPGVKDFAKVAAFLDILQQTAAC